MAELWSIFGFRQSVALLRDWPPEFAIIRWSKGRSREGEADATRRWSWRNQRASQQGTELWNCGVLGAQWETGSDNIVSFCIEHTVTTDLVSDPVHQAGVWLHSCWRIHCAHEEPTKHADSCFWQQCTKVVPSTSCLLAVRWNKWWDTTLQG